MNLGLKISLIVIISILTLYMGFRLFNLLFGGYIIYAFIDLIIAAGLSFLLYKIIKS